MFDRAAVLMMISDLSKEAYGFRVRKNYESMTDAELEQIWNEYCKKADEEEEMNLAAEKAQYEKWTAHINNLMTSNNIDRPAALRWDMQAMNAEGDTGYYCYQWGISFRHEKEIEQALK